MGGVRIGFSEVNSSSKLLTSSIDLCGEREKRNFKVISDILYFDDDDDNNVRLLANSQ